MATRIVLVTGANKGLGLAVVRRCLLDQADVSCVLACRSAKRGDAARKALAAENKAWEKRTYVLTMDQSSDESVKAAAEAWGKTGFGGAEGGRWFFPFHFFPHATPPPPPPPPPCRQD